MSMIICIDMHHDIHICDYTTNSYRITASYTYFSWFFLKISTFFLDDKFFSWLLSGIFYVPSDLKYRTSVGVTLIFWKRSYLFYLLEIWARRSSRRPRKTSCKTYRICLENNTIFLDPCASGISKCIKQYTDFFLRCVKRRDRICPKAAMELGKTLPPERAKARCDGLSPSGPISCGGRRGKGVIWKNAKFVDMTRKSGNSSKSLTVLFQPGLRRRPADCWIANQAQAGLKNWS